jgi:nucleoid DNA-binding protein
MRTTNVWALVALLGTLTLVLGLAGPALSQRPAPKTLPERLVNATRLPRENVDKFLAALGPAITEHLRSGEQVQVAGLGTFRVVRVPEHRDLVDGRPATIAAGNYVEFLPAINVANAANAAGAVPALTVPPFQYNPLPNRTVSDRVGGTRQPNVRQP